MGGEGEAEEKENDESGGGERAGGSERNEDRIRSDENKVEKQDRSGRY